MAFMENFSVFLNPRDFAVPVDIEDTSGNVEKIQGIFDNEFLQVDSSDYQTLSTSSPRFTCTSEEAQNARNGFLTFDNGEKYKIVDVENDGTGLAVLVLEKQV